MSRQQDEESPEGCLPGSCCVPANHGLLTNFVPSFPKEHPNFAPICAHLSTHPFLASVMHRRPNPAPRSTAAVNKMGWRSGLSPVAPGRSSNSQRRYRANLRQPHCLTTRLQAGVYRPAWFGGSGRERVHTLFIFALCF